MGAKRSAYLGKLGGESMKKFKDAIIVILLAMILSTVITVWPEKQNFDGWLPEMEVEYACNGNFPRFPYAESGGKG